VFLESNYFITYHMDEGHRLQRLRPHDVLGLRDAQSRNIFHGGKSKND